MYVKCRRFNRGEHEIAENVIFPETSSDSAISTIRIFFLIKNISNTIIESYRPAKEKIDVMRPYAWLHEEEVQKDGILKKVNTIFLTNRECPFKCTMCDLWRHTLDKPTPRGAIPAQIEFAHQQLPYAPVVKLYNSGNFFDGKAIPKSDYNSIAYLLRGYNHVIVENHPKLTGPFIDEFRLSLNSTFEIAMGLETIHPEVLPALNKQVTKEDFLNASEFLIKKGIDVRAFILLNPPFLLDENENIEWCIKSAEYAFDCGVTACTIIPVREGNGIMEKLRESGQFIPPRFKAIESTFDRILQLNKGRVFCDTWDLEKFSTCVNCFDERKNRLIKMNVEQRILPRIVCTC
ncbi:MAG: radical SAM protein [Balneolaceae bacterium]|nr:MAG: radical SAM protein [Balneolaceae bacterium]